MFYYLSQFTHIFTPLNVFQYVTFRAFMGAGTSFILSMLFGRWMIRKLRTYKIGQVVRQGKEMDIIGHGHKKGTPTMGGLLIIFTTLAASLLWVRTSNYYVWLVLATMLFMGGIGFLDDWLKLKRGNSDGLSRRKKMILQAVWVVIAYVAIQTLPGTREHARELMLPFLKNPVIKDLTVPGALVFMYLVLVGATNAVNLTDGLDGLAVGCASSVIGVYLVFAYIAGNFILAEYLKVPNIQGAHELAVFCGCLLGACLGFLWWNAYPAKVFMGDTGSLALGGSIAMVAILIKQEITLLIVGFVFVVEAASSLMQIYWYKWTRLRTGTPRRLFRMAPIHHHFEVISKQHAEAEGRSPDNIENSVVIRFWIISIVCALIGLATLKLR